MPGSAESPAQFWNWLCTKWGILLIQSIAGVWYDQSRNFQGSDIVQRRLSTDPKVDQVTSAIIECELCIGRLRNIAHCGFFPTPKCGYKKIVTMRKKRKRETFLFCTYTELYFLYKTKPSSHRVVSLDCWVGLGPFMFSPVSFFWVLYSGQRCSLLNILLPFVGWTSHTPFPTNIMALGCSVYCIKVNESFAGDTMYASWVLPLFV